MVQYRSPTRGSSTVRGVTFISHRERVTAAEARRPRPRPGDGVVELGGVVGLRSHPVRIPVRARRPRPGRGVAGPNPLPGLLAIALAGGAHALVIAAFVVAQPQPVLATATPCWTEDSCSEQHADTPQHASSAGPPEPVASGITPATPSEP